MKAHVNQRQTSQHQRLKTLSWDDNNSNDEQDYQNQEDQDYFSPQGRTPTQKKDFQKEFMRLHQKMMVNKSKRQQAQNIAVPQSRDTLLLKYGPLPNKGQTSRIQKLGQEEMPSYKKDAMRLIINRIYRYIGNVFEEMQKKVMRDDIMRQRKELYELMKKMGGTASQQRQITIPNDENNQSISNQSSGSNQEQPAKNSKFREMFEMKKMKIKQTLNQYDQQRSEAYSLQDSRITVPQGYDSRLNQLRGSIYETPGKDEILQIDNYSYDSKPTDGLEPQMTDTLERIQIMQYHGSQDGSAESSRKQNHRYMSDDEGQEEEEKMSRFGSFAMKGDEDPLFKQYQTRRQLGLANEPIIEQRFESSPGNTTGEEESFSQNQYFTLQQPVSVIQPAIKKETKSYLSREVQDVNQNKSNQNNLKPNKPQDLVDMSFNENPFDHRQSQAHLGNMTSSSQSSQHLIKEFGSQGQNSPDFKRHLFSSVQSSQSSKLQLISQKVQLQPLKEEAQVKAKLSDKIKEIIVTFDESQAKDELQVNGTNTAKDGKMKNLLQQMQQQFNQDAKPATQTSKLQDLKRRFKEKEVSNQQRLIEDPIPSYDTSAYNTTEKELQGKEFTDSPMGKMYKLADNQVLFEERKSLSPQKQISTVMQVKSKKANKANTAQRQLLNQSPIQLQSPMMENKNYQNYAGVIAIALKQVLKRKMKDALMELIRNQLNYQKMKFIEKLRNKVIKKVYFNEYKRQVMKSRVSNIIKQALTKKLDTETSALQRHFTKWHTQSKLEQQHQQMAKKTKISNGFQQLLQVIVNKEKSIKTYTLALIQDHSKTIQKQSIQHSKARSLTLIQRYLENKQLKLVNKKFQKFRKMVFLSAFEFKMTKLGQILRNKVDTNKREAFKYLVSHCIRNDPYKRQVEELSYQYHVQKQQLKLSQLKRVVKISNSFMLKQGFTALVQHNQVSNQQRLKLEKLVKILSRYVRSTQQLSIAKAYKLWSEYSLTMGKTQSQKFQACKKLKLLLSVSSNRVLRRKFDHWRSEVASFINSEMTKYTQEKSQVRNSVLEQLLVDMWWRTLSEGFQLIKRKAKINQVLGMLMRKIDNKTQRLQKQQKFKKWSQRVFTQRLLRVQLTAFLRSVENKFSKEVKVKFGQWKQTINASKKAQNILKILIGKQKERQLKESVNSSFQKWKLINEQHQETLSRSQVLVQLYNRIQMKHGFLRYKENAKQLTMKIQSLHQLANTVDLYHIKSQSQAMISIKVYTNLIKQRKRQQNDSMKIIKKMSQLIDKRVIQQTIMKWKLNAIKKGQQEKEKQMLDQLKSKVLAGLLTKSRTAQLTYGFQTYKRKVNDIKAIELQAQLKQNSSHQLLEKINILLKLQQRYAFMVLQQHSNQVEQETKISQAISKLSSATKICEILDKLRPDRTAFLEWKRVVIKTQAFDFGFSILDYLYKKKLRGYLELMNVNTQYIMIERTKQKMSLNLIRVILLRKHKEDLTVHFKRWFQMLKIHHGQKKSQATLPPRTQINILENSQKKKKIELLFMLPPTPNQGSQQPPKLFNSVHHSKNNSTNNSAMSQKNFRYSQKSDEEEDDQNYGYDGIHLETYKDLNNSSDHKILIKPKMSLGPIIGGGGRESLFSNRSTSNGRKNRYDNSYSPDECEEFNYQSMPKTSKNEPLKQSLMQFLQDEQRAQEEVAKNENITQDHQDEKSQSKEEIKAQVKLKKKGKKEPKSRQQQLNKYLSNSSVQSTRNQKRQSSLSQKSNKLAKHQSNKSKESELQRSIEQDMPIFHEKDTENEKQQLKELLKSQSQSKIMSPRAELEPVPELEEINSTKNNTVSVPNTANTMKKSTKPKTGSVNNKLSNFLSVGQSTSNARSGSRSKAEHKKMKKQSIENNQKFSFFLTKNQSQSGTKLNDQDSSSKFIPKTTGLISPPSNPLSYSSSSMGGLHVVSSQQSLPNFNQNRDELFEIKQGVQKLSNILVKRSLVNILEHAFTEEADERYNQRLANKKVKSLMKAIDINQCLQSKPEYLKQECFLRWKRLDYMIMLDSLKHFKNTVSQIYQVRS